MIHAYKKHEISVKTAEISPKQWDLEIEIVWTESGVSKTTTHTVTRPFDGYDEAETYGLLWAKIWIDNGKLYLPTTPL